jgi:hypothetical protein
MRRNTYMRVVWNAVLAVGVEKEVVFCSCVVDDETGDEEVVELELLCIVEEDWEVVTEPEGEEEVGGVDVEAGDVVEIGEVDVDAGVVE